MQTDDCVKEVCDRIYQEFLPLKVILFNVKRSGSGRIRGFKVCIVAETAKKELLEKRIYLDIDCEIPFDVLVYTPTEWAELTKQKNSFANRIMQEGTCVYGCGATPGR